MSYRVEFTAGTMKFSPFEEIYRLDKGALKVFVVERVIVVSGIKFLIDLLIPFCVMNIISSASGKTETVVC